MVKGDSNENIVQSWTCVSTETPSTYLMACVRDATSLPYASRASSSCPHESASIALSYSFRHFRRSNRSEDELFDGDPERITATGPRAPVLSCPCRAQPRAPTHKSKSVLHQPHSASLLYGSFHSRCCTCTSTACLWRKGLPWLALLAVTGPHILIFIFQRCIMMRRLHKTFQTEMYENFKIY